MPPLTRRHLLLALALPGAPAETLAGRPVQLPAVFNHQPAVVVWSFSREAGEQTKPWMDALEAAALPAWNAAHLEAAPRFIRPLIRSGMKKGIPPARLDHTLLLYRDEKLWRQNLEIRNDKLPLVVLLDSAANPVFRREALYTANLLAELKSAYAALPR